MQTFMNGIQGQCDKCAATIVIFYITTTIHYTSECAMWHAHIATTTPYTGNCAMWHTHVATITPQKHALHMQLCNVAHPCSNHYTTEACPTQTNVQCGTPMYHYTTDSCPTQANVQCGTPMYHYTTDSCPTQANVQCGTPI